MRKLGFREIRKTAYGHTAVVESGFPLKVSGLCHQTQAGTSGVPIVIIYARCFAD